MVPETRVFQAADSEDFVILACTIFDWSTRVTDGQIDGQTELRWLRRAESSSSTVTILLQNDARHRWMRPLQPQPDMQELDLPTPKGRKAELTLELVMSVDSQSSKY